MRNACLITSFLATLGMPAVADEFAEMREACEPVLTALYEDCSVVHYYSCADQATYIEKYFLDATSDFPSPPIAGMYDADFLPVFVKQMDTGSLSRQLVDMQDPFSLTQLLEAGRDLYAHTSDVSFGGFLLTVEMTQRYLMTDLTRNVSGLELQVVRMDALSQRPNYPDATYLEHIIYFAPERRLLIEGAAYSFSGWRTQMLPSLKAILLPNNDFFFSEPSEEMCAMPVEANAPPDPDVIFSGDWLEKE